MTRPHEGDSFIGVHADTDPYEREADRGIRKASEHIDDTTAKKAGKDLGDTISRSMGDELEKSGPELAQRVEKGLAGKRVRWKVKTVVDKDNNVVRRVVEETFQEIEDAFNSASRPGGFFSKLSQGVADAVGAGFNISGKSPLIALLVPVIGAIVGLVLAAVQAANALVAVLAAAPALLVAIGLQVGVLFAAFHGLGDAIQGAFAAKNAKELNEAIKDLTPSAQKFVRELLPLKDLFRQLRIDAQEGFFKALGSVVPQIQAALGHVLGFGFRDLATALGGVARQFALVLASPEMVQFLDLLFKSTTAFVKQFGPSFVSFFDGIIRLSIAVMPFLSGLTDLITLVFDQWAGALKTLSKDPGFQKWLHDMVLTLFAVTDFFSSVIDFIAAFAGALNAAGGLKLIDELSKNFALMAQFLASPAGVKAMEGLITVTIFLLRVFVALFIALVDLLAIIQLVVDGIGLLVDAIGWFISNFGTATVDYFKRLGQAVLDFFALLGRLWDELKKVFDNAKSAIIDSISNAVNTVKGLPDRILAAVAGFGSLLFNAGRNLLDGLINGIKSKFGGLRSIIENAAQVVRDFWPFSPAKMGPLSGSGDPMIAGQKTMQRFAEGIKMQIPDLRSVSNEATSNIVFGRDAVRVTFEGALPTTEQAQQTGSAVGAGINGQLAARNTRLAVRTM